MANIGSYCKLSLNSGVYFSTSCAGVATGSGYYVNFSNIAAGAAIAVGATVALRI